MDIPSIVNTLRLVCPTVSRQRWLLVCSQRQKLYCLNEAEIYAEYNVSTSKYGLGNVENSLKTPTGVHRIENKIGEGVPIGSVFVGREPTGEVLHQDQWQADDDRDLILSRILWLQGLQPGVNSGGECDSYARYIYIHGTHEEQLLGTAASHGCIRMSNLDILSLFNEVLEGELVYIK